MGKRKERRLAAKANAGRRFKLDLFAEPSSGDLGGSSVQDEVEVEKEPKLRAVLPNSPSTSGQPENPLLLLGQYSDDELEEDSENKPDNASTGETSSPGNKYEAEVSKGEVCLDVDVNGSEIKQHEIFNGTASLNIYHSLEDANTSNNEAAGSSEVSKDLYTSQVSASEACEPNGDVSSSWQIVMHEESGQYYYWNVVTGETSWEIPEALARESDLSANNKTPTVALDAPDHTLSSGATTNDEGLNLLESYGGVTNDVNWCNDNVINSEPVEASLVENRVGTQVGSVDELGLDLSSSLIKHGESLLERLQSVKRSKTQQQNLDYISKYTLEVEIRLSDIKVLSSFGPLLHHFWAHSERELKRLEDSINLEIYKLAQSAIIDDAIQESIEPEPDTNGTGHTDLENTTRVPTTIDTSEVTPKDQNDNAPRSEQPNSDPNPNDLTPKQEFHHSAEDFDMDVDMEVENEPPNGIEESNNNDFIEPPHEFHNPPPPPPDEEWVPPPPPDAEQIPPPPPVEPPEHLYIEPSVQYAEQYNFSYANGNFVYYGHADVNNGSNFYGQVEGSQVAVPQAQIFYSAVPSTYAETPQIAPTHLVPVAYYEFQDGSVPPVPGVSSVESSQLQAGPTPVVTYESVASDNVVSPDSSVEAGFVGETDKALLENPPPVTTVKAPTISSAAEIVSLPSTNQVSATTEVTKVQTKVVRSKKRALAVAPISRTSKKVSSLVNKWKAAKEELLEDDEESQNAYEWLEKKRQKEIKEWHAQQIASGDAKENANFQPLGGDWRERVKRRRAKLAKTGQKSPLDESNDENQQPSLTELEKDLPSGWRVYWEESLKKVYYGNIVTSETTWTRPTK